MAFAGLSTFPLCSSVILKGERKEKKNEEEKSKGREER